MSVAIIIPSFGRRAMLEETLHDLFTHIGKDDKIVVITCRDEDSPSFTWPNLVSISGRRGSSCQRNSGLDFLKQGSDVFRAILFIDDDVVLAPEFLRNLANYHSTYPAAAGFTCHLIADGAVSHEIPRIEAHELASKWRQTSDMESFIPATSPYVAFSIKGDLIGELRFDERLAEYGFMEDWDFFARLRGYGDTGYAANCGLVHLATGAGRTSHRKFGFSQITNPLYLTKKGSLPSKECLKHLCTAVAANFAGIYISSRRQRLIGNFLAFWYALRSGPSPEIVAKI
jgi:GT2 family glycosyltransferase